jgi:hypothetical protein
MGSPRRSRSKLIHMMNQEPFHLDTRDDEPQFPAAVLDPSADAIVGDDANTNYVGVQHDREYAVADIILTIG